MDRSTSHRRAVVLLALVVLALILPPVAADPQSTSKLAGDVPPESLVALARRIEPIVAELRGLPFRRPVHVEAIADSAAAAHFRARLAKEWPPERVDAESDVAAHLGLVPPGTRLDRVLLDVLDEQAGGFYDPDRGTFFVSHKAPIGVLGIVMAHELTHALDDQHFGIDSSYARVLGDADRETAYAAVVEGSGTAVMAAYLYRELLAGRLDMTMLAELQASELGRTERFEAAPPILQRQLLAPYILGSAFLVRGDLTGLASLPARDFDRAFRMPPESFEQILHPAKYWESAQLDAPRSVADPNAARLLGDGWAVAATGTLGELGIAALADTARLDLGAIATPGSLAWTHPAAAGWGGDRYWLLARGTAKATVLATLWDSEAEAREFEAAVQRPKRFAVARDRDAVAIVAGEAGNRAARAARDVAAAVAKKSPGR